MGGDKRHQSGQGVIFLGHDDAVVVEGDGRAGRMIGKHLGAMAVAPMPWPSG